MTEVLATLASSIAWLSDLPAIYFICASIFPSGNKTDTAYGEAVGLMAGAGVEEENKDMPERSLLSSEKQLWHRLFFPHLSWLLSLRKNCQRKFFYNH